MHIGAVINHLGAWEVLQNEYASVYAELLDSITAIEEKDLHVRIGKGKLSWVNKSTGESQPIIAGPGSSLNKQLSRRGWQTTTQLFEGHQVIGLDTQCFEKRGVFIETHYDSRTDVLSRLFTKLSFLHRVGKFKLALLALPVYRPTTSTVVDDSPFNGLRELLLQLHPLYLKYPFCVLGLALTPSNVEIINLTSDLDVYLMNTVGFTFDEIVIAGEKPNYDFKEQLPRNETLAREVCGFANLKEGGVILLGVDDSGRVVGMDNQHLDEIQLNVTNIVRSYCYPTPGIEFHQFPQSSNSNKSVLIIRVYSVNPKPCMANERVYIRVGPSVRPAKPDEIRQMVLSDVT